MILGVVWWWWCGGGVVWFGFLTNYKTTPTKVVLSRFVLLVGLWQFYCLNIFTVMIKDCDEHGNLKKTRNPGRDYIYVTTLWMDCMQNLACDNDIAPGY